MLNQSIIQQNLNAITFDKPVHIHVLDSVDSTNRFLRDLPASDTIEVCCAEMQTQGRGRFGRSWYSPFGENIYCSIRLRVDCDFSRLSGLGLVVSLAVLKMLDYHGVDDVCIKWPNDLLWRDKKLCGNLIEVMDRSDLVIGVGINVNSIPREQALIDKPWCSLYEIAGHQFDRNILIAQLIIQLDQHLKQFIAHGFTSFIPVWEKVDYLYGQLVTVSQPAGRLSGKASGVNEAGLLILIDETGVVHCLSSGETSLSRLGLGSTNLGVDV